MRVLVRRNKARFCVSVLFNEPKLLKSGRGGARAAADGRFSALQRAEIAEITPSTARYLRDRRVSVLFNEPKLLKSIRLAAWMYRQRVSVLFNEPKLLKSQIATGMFATSMSFSALQRAEIAEIRIVRLLTSSSCWRFQCSSTSRNC